MKCNRDGCCGGGEFQIKDLPPKGGRFFSGKDSDHVSLYTFYKGSLDLPINGEDCASHPVQNSPAKWYLLAALFLGLVLVTLSRAAIAAPTVWWGNLTIGSAGLKSPTTEQLRRLHRHRIIKIKPNFLSIIRKNEELRKIGLPQINLGSAGTPDSEFETENSTSVQVGDPVGDQPSDDGTFAGASSGTTVTSGTGIQADGGAIPSSVDNSLLPSAPPIANQGSESSCVGFSTTYYQGSHELCLARGCNNKTSSVTILSPKWTYNMTNSGKDSGAAFTDAYSLLQNNGAATWNQFPYVNGDYLSWDLNTADWISALSYRMNPVQYLNGLDGPTGLAAAKQTLANGHVLVFGTYVYSWVYTSIKTDRSAASNPYVGQWAMTYVNGTSGGHAMTIVGYDDTVWVDLNNNGVVDDGEKGAFKVANSWGNTWANSGFIWVSYDALKATSAVTNGPASYARQPAIWNATVYSMTAKASYSPRLVAQFTVRSSARNQMSLATGMSAPNATSPTSTEGNGALNYKGGAYAFDGSTTAIDGTFVLDMSDLIPTATQNMNYYVSFANYSRSYPLTVESVKLTNLALNQDILPSSFNPFSVGSGSNSVSIPYTYTDGTTLVDTTPPTAPSNLTASVVPGMRFTSAVSLNWSSSTDNVGVSAYYIYRNGVYLDGVWGSTTTYTDNNVVSGGGNYTYVIYAQDSAGNWSQPSNSASVSR